MELTDMLHGIRSDANDMREYVFENGCMPQDYKHRLRRIRRTCDKILIGEFELDGEGADGGPR